MLVTYLKSKEIFKQNFKFEKTFVFRSKLEEDVKNCKNADILLCSCYGWNWKITTTLAKLVKKSNPNCLVIFGGPQVPNYSDGFFEKYPYVDIIVHGEGEYIIENIFDAFLKDRDFSKIKGIQTKKFRNPPQPRINDLDALPSPYLTNVIWELVDKDEKIEWCASWETNRGCPYACTFCDWGSATNTKMRKFSEDRLMKEVEWLADNKIPYVDCCDSNFGIYQDRDMRIAKKIKEESIKKKYPETFRPAWAKFSSEKIIPIAKELQSAGLLRAVTLSLQSLDDNTLDIIKRQNIKFKEFSELTETFRKNGIPTYTELIMGLPGETLESFKNGLEEIVTHSKTGSINIYNCAVFPNAPMNEPVYRDYYKIKTIRSPIFLQHSAVYNRGIPEYEDIVISTLTFNLNDLKEMYLYAWMIQTFHSLGILEYISKFYYYRYNLPYIKFYEIFLDFCKSEKSFLTEEYEKVVTHIDNGYAGKGWNHYDCKLGELYWPIEEATWLRLASDKKKLIEGINAFLIFLEKAHSFKTTTVMLTDLIRFQVYLLSLKDDLRIVKTEKFNFNWKEHFINNVGLKPTSIQYIHKNLMNEKDPIKWAWEVMWFGRFTQRYKCHPEGLQESRYELELVNVAKQS